jgi:Zn finger protein HypA/HybF involved in hydrogenase expression
MLSVFKTCKQNVGRCQSVFRNLVEFPRRLVLKHEVTYFSLNSFAVTIDRAEIVCLTCMELVFSDAVFIGTHAVDVVNQACQTCGPLQAHLWPAQRIL